MKVRFLNSVDDSHEDVDCGNTDVVFEVAAKAFECDVSKDVLSITLGGDGIESHDTFQDHGIEEDARLNVILKQPVSWHELGTSLVEKRQKEQDVAATSIQSAMRGFFSRFKKIPSIESTFQVTVVESQGGETKLLQVRQTDRIQAAVADGWKVPTQRVEEVCFGGELVSNEDTFETHSIEDGARIETRIRTPLGWKGLSNMVLAKEDSWSAVKLAAHRERLRRCRDDDALQGLIRSC